MSIETPALIIDYRQMEHNIRDFQSIADSCGCTLRPHIKTHKIPRIAQLQIRLGAKGISCARLGEAEVMAAAGIDDIFIAFPLVGQSKIERFLDLSRRGRMICGADSLAGARAISDAALTRGQQAEVRLEVDLGFGRTGVLFPEAEALAKRIAALPGIALTGIYSYQNLTHQGKPTADPALAGTEEGQMLVSLAEALRKAGLNIRDVSGGSTPTAAQVATVPGITEIRPGTYVFRDAKRMALGSPEETCCARVQVTVVSTPTPCRAVIDAGYKVFAGDVHGGPLSGYGYIVSRDDLVLGRLAEEHGIITSEVPHSLAVGQQLTIIPNHICTTVNLFNELYIREPDGSLTKTPVSARGMVW